MRSETYLHKIHRLAKPMELSFLIPYKTKGKSWQQELKIKWTSYNPLEVRIGCSYFNIVDFLYTAKTTGYWGEYRVLFDNNKYESPPKWRIAIEDFERIVNWLTDIHEKKYYVLHDIFL